MNNCSRQWVCGRIGQSINHLFFFFAQGVALLFYVHFYAFRERSCFIENNVCNFSHTFYNKAVFKINPFSSHYFHHISKGKRRRKSKGTRTSNNQYSHYKDRKSTRL